MMPYIAGAIIVGLAIALLAAVVAHVGRRGERERDARQQGPAERCRCKTPGPFISQSGYVLCIKPGCCRVVREAA